MSSTNPDRTSGSPLRAAARPAEPEPVCLWVEAGLVTFRICERKRDCDGCAFYRAVTGTETRAHPMGRPGSKRPPAGLFHHPGHTWLSVEEGGSLRIGVDHMGQRLLGPLEAVRLPPRGAALKKKGMKVTARGIELAILSPAHGDILDVNEALLDDPGLINRHPYDRGWMVLVRPRKLSACLGRLYFGNRACRWFEGEETRLRNLLCDQARSGPTLQDGGLPLEDPLACLSKKKIRAVFSRFFKRPDAAPSPY